MHHIRRSAWYGKPQSTKSKGSAAPITLPSALSAVLAEYKANRKPNPEGFLFVTRNGRPPSSNKVVEYQLWLMPRRAWNPAVRSPCVPSFLRLFHRGRRILHRSSTETAPPFERAHNSRPHPSPRRSHRASNGRRFKFPEVGRSWTRTRAGKPVYSIACGASDVGSIPIARSITHEGPARKPSNLPCCWRLFQHLLRSFIGRKRHAGVRV